MTSNTNANAIKQTIRWACFLLVAVECAQAQWRPIVRVFEPRPYASYNRPVYFGRGGVHGVHGVHGAHGVHGVGGLQHDLASMQFHGIVEDAESTMVPIKLHQDGEHHGQSSANIIEEAMEYDPNNEHNPWMNSESAPLSNSHRRHRRRPHGPPPQSSSQHSQRYIQPTIRTLAEELSSKPLVSSSKYTMYRPRPHSDESSHYPDESLSMSTKYGASAVTVGDATIRPVHGYAKYRIEQVDEPMSHHSDESSRYRPYHGESSNSHSEPQRFHSQEEFVGHDAGPMPPPVELISSTATDNFLPQGSGQMMREPRHQDPHNHGGYISGKLMSTPAMATSNYEDDPIDFARYRPTRFSASSSSPQQSRLYPSGGPPPVDSNHFVIGRYASL